MDESGSGPAGDLSLRRQSQYEQELQQETKLVRLQRELLNKTQEITHLKASVKRAQASQDSAEADASAVFKENKKLIESGLETETALQREIAAEKDKASALESKVASLQRELTEKDYKLSNLQGVVDELEDDLENHEQVFETERTELEQANQRLQSLLATKATEIESLEQELTQRMSRSAASSAIPADVTERQVADLSKTIRDLEAEIVSLKNRAERGSMAISLNSILEEDKRNLETRLEKQQDTEAELFELQKQLGIYEAQQKEWSVYLSDKYTKPSQLAQRLLELETENKLLAGKVSRLDETTNSDWRNWVSGDVDRLKVSLSEKESQVERANALIQRRDLDIAALKKQVSLLEAHVDEGALLGSQQFSEALAAYENKRLELEASLNEREANETTRKRRASEAGLASHETLSSQLAEAIESRDEAVARLDLAERSLESVRAELVVATEKAEAAANQAGNFHVVAVKGSPYDAEVIPRLKHAEGLERKNVALRAAVKDKFPEMVTKATFALLKNDFDSLKHQYTNQTDLLHSVRKGLGIRATRLSIAAQDLFGYKIDIQEDRKCLVTSLYADDTTQALEAQWDGFSRQYTNFRLTKELAKHQNLYDYWVMERQCIPGFLAALFLEDFETHGVAPTRPRATASERAPEEASKVQEQAPAEAARVPQQVSESEQAFLQVFQPAQEPSEHDK